MEAFILAVLVIGLVIGAVVGYFAASRVAGEKNRAEGIKIAALEAELKNERAAHDREIANFKETKETLAKDFENLSNRIFDEKSEKFTKQNKEGLENILNPLKKEITDFKTRFEATDKDFAGKFGELKSQIEGLNEQSKTIGAEAQNLTKALKGDTKTQGNWGELILEKTLEVAGLKEGREYETQETLSGESGRRVLDVIVHLPGDKDVVIDSKVSLVAYERYCSSESEEERAAFLKEHLGSIESHIKTLGDKNYQNLGGVRSLNFVLLFIPVESAYILAVNRSEGIFKKGLDKNVVLVCPSTLLAVLRTIHSLWQMEDRNVNAQKIAGEAGKLYDKFAGFVEKMEKVGKQMNTAKDSFEDAYSALAAGRGNLVSRAEKMKQLGAKTSKSLSREVVEASTEDDLAEENDGTEAERLI